MKYIRRGIVSGVAAGALTFGIGVMGAVAEQLKRYTPLELDSPAEREASIGERPSLDDLVALAPPIGDITRSMQGAYPTNAGSDSKPIIIGYDPDGTTAKLRIRSDWDLEILDDSPYRFWLHAPAQIRNPTEQEVQDYGLSNLPHFIFTPSREDDGPRYGIDLVAVNVSHRGRRIAQVTAAPGGEVFVPYTGEFRGAMESDEGVRYEVMALRRVGDSNEHEITASHNHITFAPPGNNGGPNAYR